MFFFSKGFSTHEPAENVGCVFSRCIPGSLVAACWGARQPSPAAPASVDGGQFFARPRNMRAAVAMHNAGSVAARTSGM